MTNIPEKLGKYTIEYVLGKGGMGTVYKGYDKKLRRHVALKTIARKSTSNRTNPRQLARLKKEAEAVARLTGSPHIITVYEYDEDENQDLAFIAMEFVKGKILRDELKKNSSHRDGPFAIKKSINIVLQVLKALELAHSCGVIHRDIKPANVMLTDKGQVKLADFGIAKLIEIEDYEATNSLTQEGIVMGTGCYMSPEQVQGEKIDSRSDLFSVGILLYQLLTGRRPFDAKTQTQVMYQVVFKNPKNPSKYNRKIPNSLNKVVQKAINKDIKKRFQTAGEFAEALEEALEDKPSIPTNVYVIALLLLSLISGGILWVSWYQYFDKINLGVVELISSLFDENNREELLNKKNFGYWANLLVQNLEAKLQVSPSRWSQSQNIYVHPLTLSVLSEDKVSVDVFDSVLHEALIQQAKFLKQPSLKLGSISLISLRQRARRSRDDGDMSLIADLLNADSELKGHVQINEEHVTVAIRLINRHTQVVANAKVTFSKSLLTKEIISQIDAARPVNPQLSKGKLKVEISTSHGVDNVTYNSGEILRVFIRTNQAAYIYVFVMPANQVVTRLYPESLETIPEKVKENELFILPEDGLPYELYVRPPFGKTTLWVVALTKPLKLPKEMNDAWLQADTLRKLMRTLGLASEAYAEAEIMVETIGPSYKEKNDIKNNIGIELLTAS